ncbi:MAG: 5-oxoprolinase subunit PxpA [Pricia sp.]
MKTEKFFIDINCDVGEGAGNEAKLFPVISSCNIACGGHAGDAASMKRVVRLARKWKVMVGAHPSYPDKEGFGRESMDMTSDALKRSIHDQIAGLVAILKKENISLHHIKAHGALYNEIAKNPALASVFLEAVDIYKKDTLIYVPYASEIEKIAVSQGFSVAYEAFADRNYNSDLSLVGRVHPQALISSPEAVLKHVVRMVKHQKVRTLTAENVKIRADTFCIHSDTPAAIEIVMYLSKELPKQDIDIVK